MAIYERSIGRIAPDIKVVTGVPLLIDDQMIPVDSEVPDGQAERRRTFASTQGGDRLTLVTLGMGNETRDVKNLTGEEITQANITRELPTEKGQKPRKVRLTYRQDSPPHRR